MTSPCSSGDFDAHLDLHLHVNARPRRNPRLEPFIKWHTLCADLCIPCPHGGSAKTPTGRASAITTPQWPSRSTCLTRLAVTGDASSPWNEQYGLAGRRRACVGSAYTYNSGSMRGRVCKRGNTARTSLAQWDERASRDSGVGGLAISVSLGLHLGNSIEDRGMQSSVRSTVRSSQL